MSVINLLFAFSVSSSGLVAYRAGSNAKSQLTWFDRTGKTLGTLAPPAENQVYPELSPDGRTAAIDWFVQNNRDVWLLDGVHTIRGTYDPSADDRAVWSPDAKSIVFGSNRKGPYNLFRRSLAGGADEQLVDSTQFKVANDWSSDGRFVLYSSSDPQTGADLWVLPMEGDRKARVFLKTPFQENWARFSPDGRWVAYQSNETGRNEIYVRPFNDPSAGQSPVSTAGGVSARWRADGKELYFIAADGMMMAVPIITRGDTIVPGSPAPLFPVGRIVSGGKNVFRQQYDVAPDGRFLLNLTLDDTVTSPITLLQNWKPPVK